MTNQSITIKQVGHEFAFTIRLNGHIERGTSDTMEEAIKHTGMIYEVMKTRDHADIEVLLQGKGYLSF